MTRATSAFPTRENACFSWIVCSVNCPPLSASDGREELVPRETGQAERMRPRAFHGEATADVTEIVADAQVEFGVIHGNGGVRVGFAAAFAPASVASPKSASG